MKAMILAAGRGKRMRPLTDHTPKPLLEVGGKSLIAWHIERLRGAGIRELVINHAWLGAKIEAALGDGRGLGVEIEYSPEAHVLETAGGIAQALGLLGKAPFLVVNGDVHCAYDFSRAADIAADIENRRIDAWLVLVANPPHHPLGDFGLQSGLVNAGAAPLLTFSGIGVYHPALFAAIAPGSKAKLAPLLRTSMALGRVGGEFFDGRWADVGSPQRLAELDDQLRQAARTGLQSFP